MKVLFGEHWFEVPEELKALSCGFWAFRGDGRPWGGWTLVRTTAGHKILMAKARHRLSLQRHQKRGELWVIMHGKARVTVGEKTFILKKGGIVFIPPLTPHRLEALRRDVIWIELYTGEYDEKDIERLEDDYGRVTPEGLVAERESTA